VTIVSHNRSAHHSSSSRSRANVENTRNARSIIVEKFCNQQESHSLFHGGGREGEWEGEELRVVQSRLDPCVSLVQIISLKVPRVYVRREKKRKKKKEKRKKKKKESTCLLAVSTFALSLDRRSPITHDDGKKKINI